MTTTDERIKEDVTDELAWDTRVLATDVHIDVSDGIVRLSGGVPSHLARRSAIADAWRVSGVRRVDDELIVEHPEYDQPKTDEELRDCVERVLTWNRDIVADEIDVSAQNGVVKLLGTVDCLWKKGYAEELVLPLLGVMRVENELAIVPNESVPDHQVAKEVMCALERRGLVDMHDINVEVDDGTVTLSGAVSDAASEQRVFDVAKLTSGVKGVRSLIKVVY